MPRVITVLPIVLAVVASASSAACTQHTEVVEQLHATRMCTDSVCADPTWVWTSPKDVTPGVAEACQRSFDNIFRVCMVHTGESADATFRAKCEAASHSLDASAIASFECAAKADTCLSLEACDAPASYPLGDDVCDAIAAHCSRGCTADDRDTMNRSSAYKPAVIAAAVVCAHQPVCADAVACVKGWLEML